VAAGLILVLGMATLYQYSRLTPENLYKDNYRSYTLRESRSAGIGMPLQQAYKDGQTEAVIQLFHQLPTPSAEDYFLAGNAFLEQKRPAAAINCFLLLQKKNSEQQTHFFEEDTEYYLAMSYLENGQPARALPFFEKIHSDPAHLYHDKASSWFLRKLHWLHSGR
jgi:tetratricopeptide (TPR) repeat protein